MIRVCRLAAVAALSILIAGCGARGPLEPPPGYEPDAVREPPPVVDNLI